MAEAQAQDQIAALGGCAVLVVLMLTVGSCVIGRSAKSDPAPATSNATAPASDSTESEMNTVDEITPPKPSDAELAKAAASVKEAFFPDVVDRSNSASYQKEWWMVKGAVRGAGYPCAAVSFVKQELDGTFKAVCKMRLHSNKYVAFTLDPDAHTVVPIN